MNGNGVVVQNGAIGGLETEYIQKHHRHDPADNLCTSVLVKHIKAPVHLVNFPLSAKKHICIIYLHVENFSS